VPTIIDFFYGPLADDPHRVGKPLRDGFAGTYGAHRGSYRVLYGSTRPLTPTVTRVAGRADAYRLHRTSAPIRMIDVRRLLSGAVRAGAADWR